MHVFARALFVVVFCSIPFSAFAQWYLNPSHAEIAYEGTETLSLHTNPDGSGISFTHAYLPDGQTADATITLFVFDDSGNRIADFPSEDIWLQANDGGMTQCTGGGTSPDEDTGADGTTHWTTPLSAGGYSEGLLQVYINGDALTSSAGLNIRTNSSDINGDLVVNLVDVGIFATDFFGVYNYRSDFVCNGNLDLADVGKMAVGVGASCP